jgi:hypothetical protein
MEGSVTNTKGKTDLGVISPLMTVDETAAYTRSSRSTVYVRLGEFETVKLGKRLFITRASADRYIGRNTKPEAPHRKRRELAERVSAP